MTQLAIDFTRRASLPWFARVACPACRALPGELCRAGWDDVHGVRAGVESALAHVEALAFGEPPPFDSFTTRSYAAQLRWLDGGDTAACFPKLRAKRADVEHE